MEREKAELEAKMKALQERIEKHSAANAIGPAQSASS